MNKEIISKNNEFILYQSPDGEIKLEVYVYNENIWLTQKKIAKLFDVEVPAISKHLDNIYTDKELDRNSTISKMEIVQKEGTREVKRNIDFYNLDVIISVGYRVNSSKATQFRIWATKILKEYMIKGFSINDQRLKNPNFNFGKDYFDELLERIRSIRTSERRIYQKITDIFAECSIDYDSNSETTKNFYATIQNKFHYAITGNTAAEIIHNKSNYKKENMGLTTWKYAPKGRIIKSDTIIAKNYLEEKDIKKLEKTIYSYFDYIERIVENRTTMYMKDLSESVNKFLEFNEFKILNGKGNISFKEAEEKAIKEYSIFNKTQHIESDFDKYYKKLVTKK